ncbi:MAG: ImmA/IrrE family metallo-endopeptidase [Coriobacteriia bacterium]|nr:ImmA/IrrE family metallo-endopeptidase [Coriobacteriia bacterium]MCL2537185.1 ImmA/IrrE family metallo-endopeptidase [Coriobacteriia bacterium]
MLKPTEKRELESAVAEIIEDYGIRVYPLELRRLSRLLGFGLVNYSDLCPDLQDVAFGHSYEGFVIIGSGEKLIFYNGEAPYEYRIRFTIAHEMYHHWFEDYAKCSSTESRADYFASYLLAPTPLVYVSGARTEAEISELFCISRLSAGYVLERVLEETPKGLFTETERAILSCAKLDENANLDEHFSEPYEQSSMSLSTSLKQAHLTLPIPTGRKL